MAKNASSSNGPTHDEISHRAREIYEQSGCVPGRDVQNWLQAEAELTAARKPVAPRDNNRPPAPRNASKPVAPKTSQSYA